MMNSMHLRQAIDACEKGGVIAYPTEAVFGLGCLPDHEHAVRRILDMKQRSESKGLILVAANEVQLENYVSFENLENYEEIKNSWPGPVTWLIPAKNEVPYWLTGDHSTLAVRVSAHPVVNALCEQLGPIVSTSANPQGMMPAKNSLRVSSYFNSEVDYIFPANIRTDLKPSEIRDALTGKIVRPG